MNLNILYFIDESEIITYLMCSETIFKNYKERFLS